MDNGIFLPKWKDEKFHSGSSFLCQDMFTLFYSSSVWEETQGLVGMGYTKERRRG